jgi:hypothetical protein
LSEDVGAIRGEPVSAAALWTVLASSARGAAHHASGVPNQDAHGSVVAAGAGAVVVAVADGHGHSRHFRAGRGADLAVAVACWCAAEQCPPLEALGSGAGREAYARSTLVPSIVGTWRDAVAADQAEFPFTADEEAIRVRAHDDPVTAYGSTLLLAVLAEHWVLVVQIGDGDVVALRADGVVEAPVPGDPTLDGRYTTSLCQESAIGSFRVAAIDQSATPLLALMVATDGFGNAQVADPWPAAVGSDLVSMLRAHGSPWVQDQLPGWVQRCASSEGSGDDTTVVLAVRQP